MIPLILFTFILIAFIHLSFNFITLIWRQHRSPLRYLPGPKSGGFFMGNLGEMHDQENTDLIRRWVKDHGRNFVYRGFIGGCR